jgi:hypothetical protein
VGTGTGERKDRAMTVHQLHEMLGDLDDTRELVLEASHADDDHDDPLVLAWRSAARSAERALAAWRRTGGAEAYATYRALADQADAAQDALWTAAARRLRTT